MAAVRRARRPEPGGSVDRRIFLSYASKDRRAAASLALALRADGHEVFYDRERIKAGTGDHRVLREAVQDAEVLVFLVTPDSLRPRSCPISELKFARERWPAAAGHVLPVMLRPVAHQMLPPYLGAVSVLEPEGDVNAEVLHVLSTWSHPAAAAGTPPPAPAAPPASLQAMVLLRAAIQQAVSGSYGGGPTTHHHRRPEQARQWVRRAKLLPRSDEDGTLRAIADRVDTFIDQARRTIPAAGETKTPSASGQDDLKQARAGMTQREAWLDSQIALQQVPLDLWEQLGFRDERHFDDTIFLSIEGLLATPDGMTVDLLRRLAARPAFTPRSLVAEGYQRAVVMDVLNALLRADWARWTGNARDGQDRPGEVTPVGQRLLSQRLG